MGPYVKQALKFLGKLKRERFLFTPLRVLAACMFPGV